jgi:hypothetical protein
MPTDLYFQIKIAVENIDDRDQKNEILEFLDDLPYRLKIKTIMYIYKDAYQ